MGSSGEGEDTAAWEAYILILCGAFDAWVLDAAPCPSTHQTFRVMCGVFRE